jgi:hypothetical protein
MDNTTQALVFFLFTLSVILINFSYFHFIFRRGSLRASEGGIFKLQLISSCFVGIFGAILILNNPNPIIISCVLGCVFLHGIYSLTFLEFWALAQGSFSQEIVQLALRQPITGVSIVQLIDIGEGKLKSRLHGLHTGGMIKFQDGLWVISSKGTPLSACMFYIQKMVKLQDPG